MSNFDIETKRTKICQLFSYIQALQKQEVPISTTNNHVWYTRFSELPNFPTIKIPTGNADNSNISDGIVLKIQRPKETSCVKPPELIMQWLENGWEEVSKEAKFLSALNVSNNLGQTTTIQFEDDLNRVQAYQVWSSQRSAWQEAEKPVREAAKVFANFFLLHAKLQKELEKYQLYLGDGILNWSSANGQINHPIFFKKVELEFNSSVPEFSIRELDGDIEVYSDLLRHSELDSNAILDLKKFLEETETDSISNISNDAIFKYFIQRFFSDGEFSDDIKNLNKAVPSVYRDPVIFLAKRTEGLTEALEKLIESIPKIEHFSEALLRIIGYDESTELQANSMQSVAEICGLKSSNPELDFLLTKPANAEQTRIIDRLNTTGSVLVQGPPGTGKSHTIANIIGHALATGKTILVSSHTSKALKVLREKVVKGLRPLCVAVLENDAESKDQLKESITQIVTYTSQTNVNTLSIEIEQLAERRVLLGKELDKYQAEALEIRKSEYLDLVIAGEATSPSEAARKICEFESVHGWIPEPLVYGSPCPLSKDELLELYLTNDTLSIEEENCIFEGLPIAENFVKPSEFNEIVRILGSIDISHGNLHSEFWENSLQNIAELENLSVLIQPSVPMKLETVPALCLS